MSTDHRRWFLVLVLTVVALAPAAAAQDPVPPTEDDELEPAPDLRPDQPPETRTDPLDELETTADTAEKGLGSFFRTSFALAGAYDRLSGREPVGTPAPGPGGPGPGQPGPPGGPAAPADPDAPADPADPGTADATLSENGWVLRPSFLFVHRPSARSSLVAAYEPELENLERRQQSDRISHSAGIALEHRASRRTDLSAGASYLDSFDPSRHLGGDSFVLIPGRFEQQRLYAGLSHRLLRATRLNLYGEYSSADSDLRGDGVPFDVADLSGTIALEHAIGRRSDVTFSYGYTDTEVSNVSTEVSAPERLSGPVQAFRVGFGHRASRYYSFHIATGVLREEDLDTGAQEDSWIGSFELARESEVVELRLRYDRSLFAFGTGDVALPTELDGPVLPGTVLRDTVADTVSFHFAIAPRGRLRWEQSIWLARRTLLEGDRVDSVTTASQLEVDLGRGHAPRVGLFARFDYFDRDDSGFLGEALSRERLSLGLRVGLSGPQTRAAQRVALTELRKVLPSAGRL